MICNNKPHAWSRNFRLSVFILQPSGPRDPDPHVPCIVNNTARALQRIERMLGLRRNAAPVDDDVLTSSGIIHLKNKTIDELIDMQKFPQDQLKRYEQALRTAAPVLNERKQ